MCRSAKIALPGTRVMLSTECFNFAFFFLKLKAAHFIQNLTKLHHPVHQLTHKMEEHPSTLLQNLNHN
jgi:hypothetical protein